MGQLTLSMDDYIEIKQKIKEKLNETVHNFIIIGYYLKKVRDSGAYEREGYKNMAEFARAEYGLSAGTASRFMDINTEFSKDGNSAEIKEEYRSFAYSKLQEMLTVAPDDRGLVTENTTVQQIREIKQVEKEEREAEARAERRNLPLLHMTPDCTEGETEPLPCSPEPGDAFDGILAAFWREGENRELHAKAAAGMLTPEIAAEEICPSGSRTYRKGTDMLFFYDYDKGLKLRSYTGGSPVIKQYSYKELLERTAGMAAGEENGDFEKTVAMSQNEPREQPDTETCGNPDRAANPDTENAAEGTGNVIDGEYRELDRDGAENGGNGENGPKQGYTDEEIKNAINYFDIEYSRMKGLHQDTAKQRHYRIALECIRRCHKKIAKQADYENYTGG